MFFYEGYVCPVCDVKFSESDDVVSCPNCGAPHHRECWSNTGHCHFAANHGTSQQWRRPEAPETPLPSQPVVENNNAAGAYSGFLQKNCPQCGQANPEFSEFCSRCGHALPSAEWKSTPPQYPPQYQQNIPHFGSYGEYSPIHVPLSNPYGGIPKEEKIGDFTVEEAAAFIGPNSAQYIPRFYKMSKQGTCVSWNWAAFLITPYWLFYRKNYVMGGLVLLLTLTISVMSGYISNVHLAPLISVSTAQEMRQIIMDNHLLIYLQINALLMLCNVLISVIFALIGNYLYLRKTAAGIKKVRDTHNTQSAMPSSPMAFEYMRELGTAGGVSIPSVAAVLCITTFVQLLLNFLLVQ